MCQSSGIFRHSGARHKTNKHIRRKAKLALPKYETECQTDAIKNVHNHPKFCLSLVFRIEETDLHVWVGLGFYIECLS